MTIHLPEDLEGFIRAEVRCGHFASEDDAIAEAVRLLLRQRRQAGQKQRAAGDAAPMDHKPIWEVAAELRKSIAAAEWGKLPADGAAQLDHYVYGTAKRPTA